MAHNILNTVTSILILLCIVILIYKFIIICENTNYIFKKRNRVEPETDTAPDGHHV